MNDFPLDPFLASLVANGIRPTVRDYERISLVLRTGGPWTITRLRDTLLSLLVKDEDQGEIFLRRFRDFFKLEPGGEDAFADIDIERVLADLEQLPQEPHLPRKPKRPERKWIRKPAPETIRRSKVKLAPWSALAIVLILGLVIAIWYSQRQDSATVSAPEDFPIVSIAPPVLNFGEQLVDSAGTDEITLTNRGSSPLRIDNLTITGPHEKHFSLASDYANATIPPGESLVISVNFEPTIEGGSTASLEISNNAKDSPQRVALRGTGIVAPPPPLTERKRLYTNVPYVTGISFVPIETPTNWQKYAVAAACLLIVALLYGLYLWRSRKIPEDTAAQWNEEGPRHFPLGSIGGNPAVRMGDDILNQLADSMGYFQSEQAGKALNVPASIEATVREGGVPALEFYKRKQIRSLLILEDVAAEPIKWNPIAGELAEGMIQRGVPVLYGRFTGSPEQFKTPDGSVHRLEDLEDGRRGYLLLIFTDGPGLYRRESTFALEALRRWPMVAWMELREPCFWDETAALPTRYRIPIYPATPAGTVKAVRRFLTERSAEPDFSADAIHGGDRPSQAGTNLDAYLEQLLGDALLWAQDCAMLQPVSPGLADAVRREFHEHLPPERIERLYALPGTRHNVSGIRFSDEVLKVLREGFVVRRNEGEQEKVLRFLLKKVEEAEQAEAEKDSMAHLAWEAIKERVRLELERDYDAARLAQLAKTPLGASISANLEKFGLPGQRDKIPLRIKPRNKNALQRLGRITEGLDIDVLQAYPVTRWHWLALGLVSLSFLGFSGWSVKSYIESAPPSGNWEIVGPGDMQARLDVREGEAWQVETSGEIQTLTKMPLTAGRDYRIILYGDGYRTIAEGVKTENDHLTQIAVDTKDVERLCREEFPAIGLIVESCLDSTTHDNEPARLNTWRERLGEEAPGNRLMSVGLEISSNVQDETALQRLRSTLLQTGSVDAVYRVQPDSSSDWHIDLAIQELQADLYPWMEQSQLIWWTAGSVSDTIIAADVLPEFDRILNIGSGEDLSWVAKLEKVLEPGKDILVTEQEVLTALEDAQSAGNDSEVALIRPPLETGTLMVLIPAGEFQMGSNDGSGDERPVHTVYLNAFYMDIYEVTNAEFKAFVDANPQWGQGRISSRYHDGDYLSGWDEDDYPAGKDDHPVTWVSWYAAAAYAQWAEKRLPTEAEWEKAARGGLADKAYPWGDNLTHDNANYWGTGGRDQWDQSTAPVGSFDPNGYGLYDMAGNVWEWCLDEYDANFYAMSDRNNPIASDTIAYVMYNFTSVTTARVLRGGSWIDFDSYLRVAYRNRIAPTVTLSNVGFRCARSVSS